MAWLTLRTWSWAIVGWNGQSGPADVTYDGEVDAQDLVQVVIHWGADPCPIERGQIYSDGVDGGRSLLRTK